MIKRVLRKNFALLVLLFGPLLCGYFAGSQTIKTIAGTGTMGYSGAGGAATASQIDETFGIVTHTAAIIDERRKNECKNYSRIIPKGNINKAIS